MNAISEGGPIPLQKNYKRKKEVTTKGRNGDAGQKPDISGQSEPESAKPE